MTAPAPDLFTNVHKGIRRALFEVCGALGRADHGTEADAAARARLRDALRFIAVHGEIEDELLIPLLEQPAPQVFARMHAAHAEIGAALEALSAAVDATPAHALYHHACAFTARYLEHMREEELELDPQIRAALPADLLAGFGPRAMERTPPELRHVALGWMLPAMTPASVEALLSRLPAEVAAQLRPLAQLA